MELKTWMTLVQDRIELTFKTMEPKQITRFAKGIQNARRTFLMGSGRTGLVVEMFAMRLAQLGLPVVVVSHPTTPALEKNDLLILFSGSGETESILAAASKANNISADLLAVTQNGESSLGKSVQDPFILPCPAEKTKVLNGSLFELTLLITLDAVVAELMQLTNQSFEDLSIRHANLG